FGQTMRGGILQLFDNPTEHRQRTNPLRENLFARQNCRRRERFTQWREFDVAALQSRHAQQFRRFHCRQKFVQLHAQFFATKYKSARLPSSARYSTKPAIALIGACGSISVLPGSSGAVPINALGSRGVSPATDAYTRSTIARKCKSLR